MANVGVAAYNFDNLGLKAFFKTAGKETAKTMCNSKDGEPAQTEEGKEVQKQKHQAKTEGKDVRTKEEEEKKK